MDFRVLGKWGYLGEAALLIYASANYLYMAVTSNGSLPLPVSPLSTGWGSAAFALIAFVPGLLVGLAWFGAGSAAGSGLFKATGVLGLLTSTGGLLIAVWLATAYPSTGSPASVTSLIVTALIIAVAGLAVGAVGLVYLILEIISLFSARAAFNSKYFRYAAWGRIVAICSIGGLVVIAIVAAILSFAGSISPGGTVASTTSDLSFFTRTLFYGVATVLFLWAVPGIFAALGFRDSQVAEPAAPAPLAQAPVSPA